MRRLIPPIILLLPVVLWSCSDDNTTPPGEDKLLLLPSTTTIAADGIDQVTFQVTFNDQVVTGEATILMNDVQTIEGAVFSTDQEGKYRFTALYNKIESPAVEITAAGGTVELPEFQKNVVIHQMTSVRCSFCPDMGSFLKNEMKSKYGDRIITLGMHDHYTVVDPMHIDETKAIMTEYGIAALPSAVIDLGYRCEGTEEEFIDESIADRLSQEEVSGLRIFKTRAQGSKIGGEIRIIPSKTVDYRLNIYLVEDRLTYPGYPQVGSDLGSAYVHDNVVLTVWPNKDGLRLGKLQEGIEIKQDFEFDRPVIEKEANCRIIAILRTEQDIWQELGTEIIEDRVWAADNTCECSLGGGNEYAIKK